MEPFTRGLERRVVLRSLLVQGSWNYETLIGTGFAFTILPALRRLYPTDGSAFRDAVCRHAEVFNSHPYLATVAVGAISRLEADGVDPRVVTRFKSAMRGSLGSIGDQLVWSAWRPATVLLGILLLLAGVAWWLSVAVFILCYNTLNLGLRVWGWRIGTSLGLDVGRALREAPLQAIGRRATQAGALLGGMALVLAIDPHPGLSSATPERMQELGRLLVLGVASAAGMWLGTRSRQVMAVVLWTALVAGILLGLLL